MKNKRIIEILEMMLGKLNNDSYSKAFKNCEDGLCMMTSDMRTFDKTINFSEEEEIDLFILDFTARRYKSNSGYIYKPGAITPRINLLNRIIKEYKNK